MVLPNHSIAVYKVTDLINRSDWITYMFDTWFWHYPAKKAGLVTIFFAMLGSIKLWVYNMFGISVLQPGYIIVLGLVGVGTGCILLVYHAQKHGDENTATKKKILLVGFGVIILLISLAILETMYLIPVDDVVRQHQEVITHTQPLY